MVRQYMEVRLTVIGSSPAWPNPGSAQSGYLVEGEGAPPRLRPGRPRPPPRARGLPPLDRHHPLPPRPLGRPRALGVAERLRPAGAPDRLRRSGFRRVAALEEFARTGATTTCSTRRSRCGSSSPTCHSGPRASRSRPAGSPTTSSPRTDSGSPRTGRRSRTRVIPPRRRSSPGWPRRRPVPLRGNPGRGRRRRPAPRPPLRHRGTGSRRREDPADPPAYRAPAARRRCGGARRAGRRLLMASEARRLVRGRPRRRAAEGRRPRAGSPPSSASSHAVTCPCTRPRSRRARARSSSRRRGPTERRPWPRRSTAQATAC